MTRPISQRPIPRAVHGIVDYAYAAVLAAAPFVLGFATLPRASLPAWGFAAVVLLVTLLTRFEVGVWKVLPYRMHLAGDVLGGVFMLAAPFLFGFADAPAARNAFFVFGIFALIAVSLSQTDEMGQVRAQQA